MYSDLDYRVDLLKGFHAIMIAMNDENAYSQWIFTVPDEATDEDFMDIAEDYEMFDSVVNEFLAIFRRFNRYGLVIGGRFYK